MKKRLFFIIAIAAMVFVGCKKEKDVTYLQATIQNFANANDNKVYIDGAHYACWHFVAAEDDNEGYQDQVVLNGTTPNVLYDNEKYYIEVAASEFNASMYYSIYPRSAVNGVINTANPSAVQVKLPAVQLYQEIDGKQKVDALMAAMGAHRLNFLNICGLLEVNVTGLDNGEWLNKIEVTTTNGKVLCGTTTVSFNAEDDIVLDVENLSGGINGGKTIKLQFDDNIHGNGTYYIVVPPVSGTAFDISVHYRKPNNSNTGETQLFTKRMKQTATTNSISANQIQALTVNVATGTPNEHLPGAYSVSTDLQVYFSRGNLKYNGNLNTKWSFEPNQTSYTPSNQNNSAVLVTGYMPIWCDIQHPHAMTEPLLHDNSYQGHIIDYGSFAAPATTTGAWRTLSSAEWNFLVSRPSHSIGSHLGIVDHACYAYVKINDISGMMLFPDLFEWPATVSTNLIPSTLNGASENWNNLNYSTTEWAQLEDAGCIFLPSAGWTKWIPQQFGTQGYYWSSTPYSNASNNKNAYYFFFNNTNSTYTDDDATDGRPANSPTANQYSSYGHGYLVRLVYDPNATPWNN